MSERYLTPDLKVHELQLWEATKRDSLPPPGKEAGYGFVDAAIVPFCDQINQFEGVCTLQSCEGHWSPEYEAHIDDGGGIARTPWPGEYWLWFSESMAHAAYKLAPSLATDPFITRVQFIFIDGREIMTIQFHGTPAGQLKQSQEAIMHFLRAVGYESFHHAIRA